MFWKFGFQQASAIDTLLDRDDVSLEAVLDEDDLLQECKAQNTKLIQFLQRVDVLKRLLGYVSGQIEGEERGRFKYPYIATEVLCSEIWSIVETCTSRSSELLLPFWDSILDTPPGDMMGKINVATHFVKINAIFLSKKPDEMLEFIQSVPNVIDRLLSHIQSPPFVELIFRIVQLDEQPGNLGVIPWLSSQGLIPKLIDLMSPTQKPDVHLVAADFLKGIIALSSPSPSSFPVNPTTMSISGEPASVLPISNKLARELARRDAIIKLVDYALTPLEKVPTSTGPTEEAKEPDVSATESAVSSLTCIIPIFIELIRKNNSDFFEPYLFHTLRNRLIQIRQQQQYSREDITEDQGREELENAMKEIAEHMGLVHLGELITIIGSRLEDFQKLLKAPRTSIEPMPTSSGQVVPLTFERFRICELYAEVLHCSNMALLNRQPGSGPKYDDEGRLVGGLNALEELAKVATGAQDSPLQPDDEEDPAFTISERTELPASSRRSISSDGSSTDGISSEVMEDVLEEVHFDDDDLASDSSKKATPSTSPPSASNINDHSSTSTAIDAPLSELSLQDGTPRSSQTKQIPSPASGKTVSKPEKEKRRESLAPEGPLRCGDALKQRFLDLGIVSTLLDLFFDFPLNNFLHNVVYDLLHQVLTGRVEKGLNRELVVSLFRDSRILQRIIEGQKKNDEACSKPKGSRIGYMGHLTLISEDIVSAFDHYPPDVIDILSSYAPRPEWDQYVSGKYKETKDKDSSQLGGGKPVVGLGLAGFSTNFSAETRRKVDEGDNAPATDTQKEETGPSWSAGDDDDDTNGSSSSNFARYLAQQITPAEPLSSNSSDNSSDEEDAAWLDAANRNFHFDESGDFELATPQSPRVNRREDSFEDAFDPSSISVGHDPFDDDDDGAWGPFSDSNLARDDAPGSVSSSFTFSSASDDDGFADSFADDFGDFQAASGSGSLTASVVVEVPQEPHDDDDDGGGRTPTPGNSSFHFDDDFGVVDDIAPTGGVMLHGTENGAPLERQPLPSQSTFH
ncbi:hypothetical protein FS837_004078 [Tulasnella sp. UAMH 9824]|nr:hypothetical protein FS837_004078 [Tulasnella sp. UAMH 9824]